MNDIVVGGLVVRCWSADGGPSRRDLAAAFAPLARTGLVGPYVALMPDHHGGGAAPVGAVIPTSEALLPGVLGGDIGCGMAALRLPLPAEALVPRLAAVHERLAAAIPVGRAWNEEVTARVRAAPVWGVTPRAPLVGAGHRAKLERQLGSLGGGNHFLELRADEEDACWAWVHSGSRFLGQLLREHALAHATRVRGVPVLPAGSSAADDFLHDQAFVLAWARASRGELLWRTLEAVAAVLGADAPSPDAAEELVAGRVDVPHNFVAVEEHGGRTLFVHRKGAARAGEGEPGLIPGSMGTLSYVVEGRGAAASFCSSSHGAGRVLTRTEARRAIGAASFRRSMEGVVHDHDPRLRDEAPAAYRDIRAVLRAQRDLVRIRHTLRPLLVRKGVDA